LPRSYGSVKVRGEEASSKDLQPDAIVGAMKNETFVHEKLRDSSTWKRRVICDDELKFRSEKSRNGRKSVIGKEKNGGSTEGSGPPKFNGGKEENKEKVYATSYDRRIVDKERGKGHVVSPTSIPKKIATEGLKERR